jgi:hypothetical protein
MTLPEYLASGALIQILKTNTGGNPPSVWITHDSDGTYRYVFTPGQNSVGGKSAPFLAFQDNKIFRPEKDNVIAFLCTFGLSTSEAEYVVRQIGTEPPDNQIPRI